MKTALFVIVPMLFLDSLFEGTIFESKPEKAPETPAEICAMMYGKAMSLKQAARRAQEKGQYSLALNDYYKTEMVLKNIQATDEEWNCHAVGHKIETCERFIEYLEDIVEEKERIYTQELSKLQGALEKDPENPERYTDLADFYFMHGKPHIAEVKIRMAMQLDENDPDLRLELGHAYEAQERHEDAIREYRRVITLDPDSAIAHYNLGIAYFKKRAPGPLRSTSHKQPRTYPEAVGELRTAITIDPEFVDAYTYLGIIYNRQQQYSRALAVLKKAYELNPNSPVVNYNLGSTHCSLLNFVNATSYMNRAASLVGRDTEIGQSIRDQITNLRRYNLKGQEGRGYRDRMRMLTYKGRTVSGPKFQRWKRRRDKWADDYQKKYHPPPL